MDNPGETLPGKRFALSLPPPEDPSFARIQELLLNTVTRTANRLRTQCAIAHNISFFETAVRIVPDPDRPSFITVTAYPLAINERPDVTTEHPGA